MCGVAATRTAGSEQHVGKGTFPSHFIHRALENPVCFPACIVEYFKILRQKKDKQEGISLIIVI